MGLDPELLRQLILTFKTELAEQSQVITNGLINLEKGNLSEEEISKIIANIFRSAHNLKGASRGLGITYVGDIAHKLESLFSDLQNTAEPASHASIDFCLQLVDRMNSAFESFIADKPIEFDINYLLNNDRIEPKVNTLPKTIEIPQDEKKISSHKEQSTNETIRVSVDKIDKVSAIMEEIHVNKIAIDDYYAEITKLASKTNEFSTLWKKVITYKKENVATYSEDNFEQLYTFSNDCLIEINKLTNQINKNMRTQVDELSILSNSLQEEIRMLRLVPAANLFSTLPRYVRDLSSSLQKQVNISIRGDEVKMDKLVLDGLKDPINHIIRNAIDHGIETPDERKKLGKPESGLIQIDIKEFGNQILISIHDDGSGIDVKKISSIIKAKNLMPEKELSNLNKLQILDCIFLPGFSTKENVTDISGRGVGLDVVKANLITLKGSVTIETIPGKGTTFALSVPLTLSSERGLLVRSNKQLFVLPTHSVERVLTIDPSQIIPLEGTQAILIEDHPVLICMLSEILGFKNPLMQEQNKLSLVILKQGWHRVAFLVDEIVGEREIVMKPLQPPLTNIPCVSGGTLLERNQVIIVLNPNHLLNAALQIKQPLPISAPAQLDATSENKSIAPHILVVDDSITTRTLEKSILESKNYKVTVAVNGQEAWDLIQKNRYTLVITDVSMPIMDGFTLTDKIKKNEKFRHLPVIIVTSLDSQSEKARGIEVGANAYIVKNEFESGKLLEIIKQLV